MISTIFRLLVITLFYPHGLLELGGPNEDNN